MTGAGGIVGAMDWVTALATVVLAIVAVLAYRSNSKLAAATQVQARTAEAVLERQIQPYLVPGDPESCYVGELVSTLVGPQTVETKRVHIAVENAGAGIALIRDVSATSERRGPYTAWAPPAVPAGTGRLLKLTPGGGVQLDPFPGETIKLSVKYEGLDGVERELEFEAEFYPGGDWVVRLEAVAVD